MALPVPSRSAALVPGDEAPFLGRGWSFPPAFSSAAGSVRMVAGLEDIRQSLFILFSTAQGERLMHPTYGCDLWRFAFRERNAAVIEEIRDMVATAIVRWEPRIDLIAVEVEADRDEPAMIRIVVDFAVRRTNSRTNLVFPYHFDEATLAEEY